MISFLKFGALTWVKVTLGCRLGFHRWGGWGWRPVVLDEGKVLGAHRVCLDCGRVQGPLFAPDERRVYESWRDR